MSDYTPETYKGVSRNDCPDWEGWKEIDRHKTMYGFPDNLKFSNVLQDAWNKLENQKQNNDSSFSVRTEGD